LLTRRAAPHTGRAFENNKNRGLSYAMSISYLPAAFTTLFFLAASLLLGLMS
jgi:hypothetical protein